jgi:hypothetical protein
MPTNITAMVTDQARAYMLGLFGSVGPSSSLVFSKIVFFKVGEGGWIDTAIGRVPRDPTDPGPLNNRGPLLTDLDAIQNPSDYPQDSRATFTKALVAPTDFALTGNSTLVTTCTLDFGDFNDDGNGNFPEIYEIGLFADTTIFGTILMAYGTFPRVKKDPSVSRTFVVRIAAER